MDEPQSTNGAAGLGDYHIHTCYSDGEGEVAEFVERAIALGLSEIGFADHLVPPGLGEAGSYGIDEGRLDRYVREVRAAGDRYPEIRVLLSVEADYLPEHEDALAGLLAAHPFDYVVGSIHFVDDFDFADEAKEHHARWDDVDAVFSGYYRTTRRAAESGLFHIMAHVGYIGLWGHTPSAAVAATEDEALRAIAAAGIILELNTGGVLDPAGDMYPSPSLLERACRMGIPLTFSSDAHSPQEVGMSFPEGAARARKAGYASVVRMSDRGEIPLP